MRKCVAKDAIDPVAQWLDGVIDPKTLEELPFDLLERRLMSTGWGEVDYRHILLYPAYVQYIQ